MTCRNLCTDVVQLQQKSYVCILAVIYKCIAVVMQYQKNILSVVWEQLHVATESDVNPLLMTSDKLYLLILTYIVHVHVYHQTLHSRQIIRDNQYELS